MKYAVTISILVLSLTLAGCATQPAQHGIPNFGIVSAGVYRGGTPTAAGVEWLVAQGVTNEVSLNGKRAMAGAAWHDCRITGWQEFWGNGVGRSVSNAVAATVPGTFIHCTHGKNRTGTMVMFYRMTVDGWSYPHALAEAKQFGWADSLPGLKWWIKQQTSEKSKL